MDVLSGLREITDQYDTFLLDIWGVIHDGVKLYPHTVSCLEQIREAGKTTCLLSNTPLRRHDIIASLAEMGVARGLYDHVVTAGDSAHEHMKDFAGQKCWFAAAPVYLPLLEGTGIECVDRPEDADFTLNAITNKLGWDESQTKDLLDRALARGLPMICADPDIVVNHGDTIEKCSGAYALYYEEKGGTVTYHGKPHLPVYEMAWSLLGKPDKARIAAIGDSFHTDIQGAGAFGIDSVLNLAGIHNGDSGDLEKLLSEQDFQPVWCISEFVY